MDNLKENIKKTLQEINQLNEKHAHVIAEYSLLGKIVDKLNQKNAELEKSLAQHKKRNFPRALVNFKNQQDALEALQKKLELATHDHQSLTQTLHELNQDDVENTLEDKTNLLNEKHAVRVGDIEEQLKSMVSQKSRIQAQSEEAKVISQTLAKNISWFENSITETKAQSQALDKELDDTYQNLCRLHALNVPKFDLEMVLHYSTNFKVIQGTYWRLAMIALEEKNIFKAYQYLSFMNKESLRTYQVTELLKDVQERLIEFFRFENLSPINIYQKAKFYHDQPDIVIGLCLLSISIDHDYRFYIEPYRLLVQTLIEKDAWFEADIFLTRILNFEGLPDKQKFLDQALRVRANKTKLQTTQWFVLHDRTDATPEELESFRAEMITLFKTKMHSCQNDLLFKKIQKTRFVSENAAAIQVKKSFEPRAPKLMDYINDWDSKPQNPRILEHYTHETSYLKSWVHFLHDDYEQLMNLTPYFKEIPLEMTPQAHFGAGL